MKQKITAGGELDVLTFQELSPIIRILDSLKVAPFYKSAVANVSSSGSINSGSPESALKIYSPPENRAVRLFRLQIDSIGVDPDAPITAGWMRFLHSDIFTGSNCITFCPQNGQIAPISVDYNSSSAPIIKDGIFLLGGGLSPNLQFNLSLTLGFADYGSMQ